MEKQILYFLRHGQTQFNVFRRLQGWSNSQLTPSGIQAARQSGEAFGHIPFDAVYSSDLTRALDTAKLFLSAAGKDLPIIPSRDLREIGFGYFEGLDGPGTWRLADVKAADMGLIPAGEEAPEALRIDMVHLLDPYHLAEDYRTFLGRLRRGVETILRKNPEKQHILLFSHSSVIKAVFDTFDPDFQTPAEARNGSISSMAYDGACFRVLSFNQFTEGGKGQTEA